MFRRLTIEFQTLDEFQLAYQRNIANGGLFAPTEESFEIREVIELELSLCFCDRVVPLQCEVVGRRAPNGMDPNQQSGVAVQFLEPIDELRSLFSEWITLGVPPRDPAAPASLKVPGATRSFERSTVYARVQVISTGGVHSGETRNLSGSGALLTLHENPPPQVGEAVTVELMHPANESSRRIPGRVVRSSMHLRDRPALAVAFEIPDEQRADLVKFVVEICESHGTTASEAITGPIHELELPNLVQMFSSSAEAGVLIVISSGKSGRIVFASGRLQEARVGLVSGLKALSRILTWQRGRFEFVPNASVETSPDEPIPMYSALLEAVQYVDEVRRLDLASLPATGALRRTDQPLDPELSKPAQDVLTLLDTVYTVADVIDASPEYDAVAYRALLELIERGVVEVELRPGRAR